MRAWILGGDSRFHHGVARSRVGRTMMRAALALGTSLLAACSDSDHWTAPEPPEPVTPREVESAITITFDDGFLTTYTVAFPILQEYGLRANVGVVREYSELAYPSYLSLSQLRELSDAGWSMVSHSVTHPRLDSISVTRLRAELIESKAWLDKNDFRGSSVFIVPYHSLGDRELEEIKRYYRAARGLSALQFWPDSMVSWPPADPFALTAIEPERPPFDFTTSEGRELLRTFLDRVVAERLFIDIFFHQIPPAKADSFRELVELLAEYKEWILPYHELFESAGE